MKPRLIRRIPMVLALIALPLAAAPREFPNPSPRLGTIGVSVRILGSSTAPAELVYFCRLDDADRPLEGSELITSDLVVGSQAFLLHAEPGRWAAVAAARVVRSRSTQDRVTLDPRDRSQVEVSTGRPALTYFDTELVRQTVVEVRPGELAFQGELLIEEREVPARELDAVQSHYAYALEPERARENLVLRAARAHRLQQDATTAREFWQLATKKVFKGAKPWITFLEKQLAGPTTEPTPPLSSPP